MWSKIKTAELGRLRREEWRRQICNEVPDLYNQKFTDDQAYTDVKKFIETKQTYLRPVLVAVDAPVLGVIGGVSYGSAANWVYTSHIDEADPKLCTVCHGV